jgi:hypothetical protein
VSAATFLCVKGLSLFGIKNGWFAEQPFEARVTAWGSVEGGNESVPTFRIEREDGSIRQPFLGFAQRRFQNEFAYGLAKPQI